MKRGYRVVVMLAGLAGAVACSQTAIGPNLGLPSSSIPRERSARSIHRFDHVVILIQENRSFDNFSQPIPVRTAQPTDTITSAIKSTSKRAFWHSRTSRTRTLAS